MSLRRLYGAGFEGWDHSPAGYYTDYVISVECVILAVLVFMGKKEHSSAKNFMAFACLTAIAFGGGGVAHHMMDVYFHRGEAMHHKWGQPNSGWMYPWLLTGLSATAASAAAAVSFSFTSCGDKSWAYVVLYVLGSLIALYEVKGLADENTASSGVIAGLVGMAFGFLALVFAAVGAFQSFQKGVLFAGVGSLFWFFSMLFVSLLVPASCRTVGDDREGCPFPEAFNQNAVFHVIVMISVAFFYLAPKAASSNEFEALIGSE